MKATRDEVREAVMESDEIVDAIRGALAEPHKPIPAVMEAIAAYIESEREAREMDLAALECLSCMRASYE